MRSPAFLHTFGHPGLVPLWVGAVVLSVTTVGLGVPSLWFDEAATVSAALRDDPSLDRLVTHVDAVHALYYRVLHVWFDLVGYSPSTLRVPSALGTSAAAALTVVLARLLTSGRAAAVAGLLVGLGPRLAGSAVEGRSSSLAAAAAVGLTIVLILAVRATAARARRAPLLWVLYTASILLVTHLFLYLLLLVVAHAAAGATLVLARRRADPTPDGIRISATRCRSVTAWFVASTAVAGMALVPFLATVVSQSAQVSWIPRPGIETVQQILVSSWFPESPVLAVVTWALALLGGRHLLRRREDPRSLALLTLALAWLIVPTSILLCLSLLREPVYLARYVGFGAPALALLGAVGIMAAIRRPRLRVLAAATCAILSLVTLVQQRLPEAAGEVSWSQAAEALEQGRGAAGLSHEAVVFGSIPRHDASAGALAVAYPSAFDGLDDVLLERERSESDTLWDDRAPVTRLATRLTSAGGAWFVGREGDDAAPAAAAEFTRAGLHLDERVVVGGFAIEHHVR